MTSPIHSAHCATHRYGGGPCDCPAGQLLKPCPWCGSEVRMENVDCASWQIRCSWVRCRISPSTGWLSKETECVAVWNNREVAPPAPEVTQEQDHVVGEEREAGDVFAQKNRDDTCNLIRESSGLILMRHIPLVIPEECGERKAGDVDVGKLTYKECTVKEWHTAWEARGRIIEQKEAELAQTYAAYQRQMEECEEKKARVDSLDVAIRTELEHLSDTIGTHWEGCETSHRKCAAIMRLKQALATQTPGKGQ